MGFGLLAMETGGNDNTLLLFVKKQTYKIIPELIAAESNVNGNVSESNDVVNVNDSKNGIYDNYYDKELGVFYTRENNGKYRIQESVWKNYDAAISRMKFIQSLQTDKKISVYLVSFEKLGETYYKILIGRYNSVNDARKSVIKFKNHINLKK